MCEGEQERVSEKVRSRLLCERVLNESWSKVKQHKNELDQILERGTILTERDKSIVFAAADAFLQRVNLETVDEEELGLYSSVPCGRDHKTCDECPLKSCDYFKS